MTNLTTTSSEEFWDAVYDDIQYKASKAIGKYVLFILFIFGTVGNLLSFAVMVRKRMRASSTAFYMASLAIADTTVMFVGCLRRWVFEVFEVNLLDEGPVACWIVSFLQYWSFDVAVWILVIMTIDRAIVVIKPLKAYIYTTRCRSVIALVVVIIICTGINTHFFFTTVYTENRCAIKEGHKMFHSTIWPWVDATVYSFLPFILLLIMNIVIISFLSKASAKSSRMTNHFKTKRKTEQQNAVNSRKLSIMLLTVTTAFILLTGSSVVLQILRKEGEPFFNFDNPKGMAKYILTTQISRVLLYMNHSINFFLYCITGSKFRRELVAMIRCQSARDIRRRSTVVSMPASSMNNLAYTQSSPEHESVL